MMTNTFLKFDMCSSCHVSTPRQKYLYTANYPCTDCAISQLKNQLGAKMGIEIHRYQKFVVLALTWVKFFNFLTFHEVLIY